MSVLSKANVGKLDNPARLKINHQAVLDGDDIRSGASSTRILDSLKDAGVNFVVTVPCSLLTELIELVDSDENMAHVPVTREEEGIGVLAGAHFGGRNVAAIMQNSGVGNSINALASLCLVYKIPMLLLLSHRGGPGEEMSAQVPMGQATPNLLKAVKIPCFDLDTTDGIESTILGCYRLAQASRMPVAIFLSRSLLRS